MQSADLQNETENRSWVKFLASWSLITSIIIVSLVVTILTLVMPASRPNPLGDTYFELMAAGYAPALYRLSIMFDVAAWIGWGGLLIGFAALLRRLAPVQATLIALLASGMSLGFIGACLRIAGTPHLANQYFSKSASQQGAVIQSYDSLLQIITILFSAGGLLGGTALLLIASSARYLPKLPRWTIILIGIAGSIHMIKAVLELASDLDLGPLALLANILLVVALVTISKKFYTSHSVW
jgi:hypothetical protein